MSMTSTASSTTDQPYRASYKVSLADLDLEAQKFTNKEDIKPWLLNCLARRKGIHVVIERSDTSKIIFKCKNKEKKTKIIEAKNIKSKIQVRRLTSCPFKIRANFSLRNKVWTLSVVNDTHDHIVLENDENIPIDLPSDNTWKEPASSNTKDQSSTSAVSIPTITQTLVTTSNKETTKSSSKPSSSSSSSSSLSSAVGSAVSTVPTASGSSPEYAKRAAFLDQYVNDFPSTKTSSSNDVFSVLVSPTGSLPGQRDIFFDAPFVLPKPTPTTVPAPDAPPPAKLASSKTAPSLNMPTFSPSSNIKQHRKRSVPNIKKEELKKRRRSMPLGLEPQPLFHDTNLRVTPTRQEVLESLRQDINYKVNLILSDNSTLFDKSDVLESFVLQVIDDHWRYFGPRFMYRLRAMAEKKRKRRSDVGVKHPQEDQSQDSVAAVVAAAEAAQAAAVAEEAAEAVVGVVAAAEGVVDNSKKASSSTMLSGWLNPPTPGMSSAQASQTANLIPLSPLLNEDSDNDYNAAPSDNSGGGVPGSSENGNIVSIGPRIGPEMPNSGINPLSSGTGHLPGLNATTNLNSYLIGSGSQLQSIQNQSQQLPPFNSIQNKLPSPPTTQTMLNMSNTNAMVNSVFNISSLTANINNSGTTSGTALMPLLATSNTLNPSHLFKTSSNSKNNMLFGTTTSSGNNLLNELKLSNSQYGTQSSTPQQFANNSFSASFGLGQLGSSRDTTTSNSGNPGANSGTNAGGNNSASVNGISSSILNNIGSFNDSGW